MRLLRMDGGHQGGGVREALCPECFYGEVSIAQAHKEEVKARLRDRLQHFSSGDDLDLAQSRASASPKTPPRAARCQHQWNRRGTNAYIKMKTCHLCGLQETFRYKDGLKTTNHVDVSKIKKSRRPCASSP